MLGGDHRNTPPLEKRLCASLPDDLGTSLLDSRLSRYVRERAIIISGFYVVIAIIAGAKRENVRSSAVVMISCI